MESGVTAGLLVAARAVAVLFSQPRGCCCWPAGCHLTSRLDLLVGSWEVRDARERGRSRIWWWCRVWR